MLINCLGLKVLTWPWLVINMWVGKDYFVYLLGASIKFFIGQILENSFERLFELINKEFKIL